MKIDIRNFLPEELSDESAYHLVNFFMYLSLELESYYFAQIRRYVSDNMSKPDLPDSLQNQFEDDLLFQKPSTKILETRCKNY